MSGFAIFEDGKLLDYGHFSLTCDDFGVRLQKVKEKVKELIEKNNIDYVIFEDIQLKNGGSSNVLVFKKLAEVYGVIYEYLTETKMPNESVLAVQWRSTLEIKGRVRQEQKKNAQTYVLSTYGKKCTEDEADAICIGTHYFLKKEKEKEAFFDWTE